MRKPNVYTKASASVLALLFAVGILVGGLMTYYISFQEIKTLNDKVAVLQSQLSDLQGSQNITYQNITIYQNATALADIYENVRKSVVLVQGTTSDGDVQGSGFVYDFSGTMVVITNYPRRLRHIQRKRHLPKRKRLRSHNPRNRPIRGLGGSFS